jgi:hypothetical protein
MTKITLWGSGIALALAALMTTGCTKTLKKESVEGVIKSAYEKNGLKLKSVSCPAGKEVKQGDTFDCTAEIEGGGKATIGVTQKDAKGTLDFNAAGVYLSEASIAAIVTKNAGAPATAKCSTPQVLLRKGEKYVCEVSVGDQKGKLTYTTMDEKKAEGELAIEGKPPVKEEAEDVADPAPAEVPEE